MIKKDLGIKVLMKLVSGMAYNQEKEKWKKLTSKLPDNFYYFELWKPEKQRTSPQNRYYFGVVVKALADYCGYMLNESEEIEEHMFKEVKKQLKKSAHQSLKERFLFLGYIKNSDVAITRSTTDLNINDFWDYVEQTRIWLKKEHNIETEDPTSYKLESYQLEKEKNEKNNKK